MSRTSVTAAKHTWSRAMTHFLVLAPVTGFADAPEATTRIGESLPALPVLSNLLLVVGLIVGLAWLAKRFGHLRTGNGQAVKIVASQNLGAKERVVVIDVGGQQLVLGLSASAITTLHVPDRALIESHAKSKADLGGFAEKLRQSLGGNKQ